MLTVINEFSLAVIVARRLNADDVLFVKQGIRVGVTSRPRLWRDVVQTRKPLHMQSLIIEIANA